MTSLLQRLWRLLNRDLTGRTWTTEASHPYFGNLTYFGQRDPTKAFWEAEIPTPAGGVCVVTMQGTPDGPLPEEEAFCRQVLADSPRLLERCQPLMRNALAGVRALPPAPFTPNLGCFSVPPRGDANGPWEVCYYVAGGDVTVQIREGQPREATFHM